VRCRPGHADNGNLGNHGGKLRGTQAIPAQERAPLSPLLGIPGERLGQPVRQRRRCRGAASVKGRSNGGCKAGAIHGVLARQCQQVEEVFHPAVGNAEGGNGLQLFGEHRLAWVDAQARWRKAIQHHRIGNFRRWGGDRVAKPHIPLHMAARSAQIGDQAQAQPLICSVFAGSFDGDAGWIETQAVVACHCTERACDVQKMVGLSTAESEEIGIPCGPVWCIEPGHEQQGALQQELVAEG